MTPDDFARRLKELRDERGIGSRELSERIDRSPAFISLIESRQRYNRKMPPLEALQAIAREFEMTLEELLAEESVAANRKIAESVPWYVVATDEELMERAGITIAPANLAAYVEGLSLHAGDQGSPIIQDLEDTFGRVLEVQAKSGDPIRWFRVFGKCMEPRIDDGDWVYIDREMPIEPGKFVAAVVYGEQAVVRKLAKKNGRFWLETLDGAPPVLVTDGIRIIGRIRHRQSTFA